ncbi:MAG TPA: CHAT domain-containing protein, partial [Povalibacter sp.]|nr:CHAT domain-containing protein [Povalibacter sp.]
HIDILKRVLEAPDAEARGALFVEGLSRFGPRFLTTLYYEPEDTPENAAWRETMTPLRDEASTVVAKWLNGTDYLGSADEAERRARLGIWMLDMGQIGLARLISKSILSLPEAHPLHDRTKARDGLLRYIEAMREGGDAEGEILAIGDLLRFDLLDDNASLEFIARGEELFPKVDAEEYGRDFLLEAFSYYLGRTRDATTDADVWRAKRDAVYERIANIGSTDQTRAKNLLVAALALHEADEFAAAVDAFHRAREGGFLSRDTNLMAARYEVRLRLGLPEQDQQVIDIVTPLIDAYEEQYIAAVEASAIDEAGATFNEMTMALAFANAALGHWKEAVAALERGKSLRLRHQAALRRSPAGATLLALEEQLHALGRGVEPAAAGQTPDKKIDWIGAELSAQTRVLEEYRRMRATLPHDLAAHPTLADIAGSLMPGEMALLMGLSYCGTLITGVMSSDSEAPSLTLLRPDLTMTWLGGQLLGADSDGFILALEAGEELRDPRPPLDRLLTAIDAAIGSPLAALLERHGVQRLVVVPHSFYNFVPFCALPAFAPWEVVTVPSAAHFVAARRTAPRTMSRAAVVGDPTADLPISPAETQAVHDQLVTTGLEIVSVAPEDAMQHELARVVADCDVVHFCGHGRAELTNPMRAALLLRPAWDHTPLSGPDDFDRIVGGVTEWKKVDEEHRAAEIAGIGHLLAYDNTDSGEQEYFLEYSADGTLWARYLDGQRLQIAELWTAGDLMVQRAFERCELAFLSACSTSSGGITELSEAGGLPGALLLAGVPTIVATQWPVSDMLSALYVDLFYAELVAKRGRRVVATIART